MAQPGRALAWGARGRGFKSRRSDQPAKKSDSLRTLTNSFQSKMADLRLYFNSAWHSFRYKIHMLKNTLSLIISITCLFIQPTWAKPESSSTARPASLSFSQDPAVNSFDLTQIKKNQKGKWGVSYTIDTRDQEACQSLQKKLKLDDRACSPDSERPYSSVIIFYDQDGELEYGKKLFSVSNDQVNNTKNVLLIDIVTFIHLLKQPSSETHWEGLTYSNAGEKYFKNATSTPVFDKDSFVTNYLTHPLAGSVYYSIARHSGSSAMESFAFSVICSTFLWEYGIEAIPERPSLNDLFATPILGSLLGELSYRLSQSLENNGGRLLGSPALGAVARAVVDPGYFLAQALDGITGVTRFQSAGLYWVIQDNTRSTRLPHHLTNPGYRRLLMQLRLKF